MEINMDTREFNRTVMRLSNIAKDMPQASVSALNRALDYMATQAKKEVTKMYAIKSGDIAQTIKKNKASTSNMNAYLKSSGNTLTLYNHFNVTPRKPPKSAVKFVRGPKGRKLKGREYKVRLTIKKNEGKKDIHTNPKPFIASANNATQIFVREGKSHNPVDVLRTLSVPQMISNNGVVNKIEGAALKKLQERIEHEVIWRMQKAGGK